MYRKKFKILSAKKSSLFISPNALALAACGGGGASRDGTVLTTNVTLNDNNKTGLTFTGTMATASTFPITGNNFIDATTMGSKWSPQNGILTYAVANGFDGEEWDDIDFVNNQLETAMGQIAYYTNLKVQNLGNFADPTAAANAGGTIVLSLDGSIISSWYGDDAWAVGFYPNATSIPYEHVAGDMFLNLNSEAANLPTEAYSPGGKGFMLILHELGHALGLKHPFDETGGRLTYEQAGYADYQDQTYTVMAYEDEFGDVLNAPSSFMLGDVLGLMWLYGVNYTTNSGNSTYIYYDATPRKTIWDASGSDTLDLTAMTDPVKVYLPYLYSDADLGMEYGHIIQNPDTNQQKWHHLMGEFETILCGSGDDIIHGDEQKNTISGGAGNDFIAGWEENDVLTGGGGDDFFMLAHGHGQDVIKDFEVGIDTCGFWNGSAYDASLATLSSAANGDAMYIMTDGSSFLLEGVLQSDFSLIA